MGKRRSFGSIERVASGRYRARVHLDGAWVNAPTTFRTKAEAEIWLDSVRVDRVRGAWKAPRTTRITVDQYGTKWIQQRHGLKASTRREYESCWRNHVSPYFGAKRLDSLSPAMIRDGSATAARAYRLLHSVYVTAVEDDLVSLNPCRIKGASSPKAAERPVLSIPEVLDLTVEVPDRYEALVHLLVWSGLRVGEAAALQRRDLDLTPGRATLTVGERAYPVKGVLDIDTPKSRAGLRTIAIRTCSPGRWSATWSSSLTPLPTAGSSLQPPAATSA